MRISPIHIFQIGNKFPIESGVYGQYPVSLENGYILFRISRNRKLETTGFLCRLFPEDKNHILPHENVLTERIESKLRETEKQPFVNKPVCLLHHDHLELTEHVTKGFQNGKIIVTCKVGELLYEYSVMEDRVWNDQLATLVDRIPVLVIADGHHRTAAYFKRRKTTKVDAGLFSAVLPLDQIVVRSYHRKLQIHPDHQDEFRSSIHANYSVRKLKAVPEDLEIISLPSEVPSFLMVSPGSWERLTDLDTTSSPRPGSADLLDHFQKRIIQPYLDRYRLSMTEVVTFLSGGEELRIQSDIGSNETVFLFPPVSPEFLWEASYRGEILPAKSTWIEPRMLTDIIQVPNLI